MPRKLTTEEFIKGFGKCFCSKGAIAILEQTHGGKTEFFNCDILNKQKDSNNENQK
jgi:hypothetical protein